jgi:two-component system sensor histidine kinase ChiS
MEEISCKIDITLIVSFPEIEIGLNSFFTEPIGDELFNEQLPRIDSTKGVKMTMRRKKGHSGGTLQRNPPILLILLVIITTTASMDLTTGNSKSPSPPPPKPAQPTTPAAPAPPSILSDASHLLAFQAQDIRFGNLSLDDGLSQSVVLDILQDDLGFMWFATQEGLNRYDGYEFKVFKTDSQNPNSLTGNLITSIDKDSEGTIWIATSTSGLNRYDPKTGIFSHFLNNPNDPNSLSSNSLNVVMMGKDSLVWVGTTQNGLDCFDPDTGTFTHFVHDPNDPDSISSNAILSILEDRKGTLWVGTINHGLNHLDRSTGKFTHYVNDPKDLNSISQDGIQSIYQDRQGTLWIGTFTGGLNRFDQEKGNFIRYLNDPENPASLSHNSVLSIFEDQWAQLWVATNGGGLNLLDRKAGTFTQFRNDPNNPDSLPNDQIYSIFEDLSGMLWFGTFGSGIATFDPYKDKFYHIRSDPLNPNSLSNNIVWSIFQDAQEVLWIGTNGGGLNKYDPKTGKWSYYQAGTSGLASDFVFTIYQDRSGMLWLGTQLGLNRFDPRSGDFELYAKDMAVMKILEDDQGLLWFGTLTNGLGRLDRQNGTLEFLVNDPSDPSSLENNMIFTLNEDEHENLWIGTNGGGLNLYNRLTNQFVHYVHDPDDPNSISDNTVLSIYPTGDDTLWLGTMGGINRFDMQTKKFTAFREKDGLPNDLVYGILEDDQGNLWASTNRGISRFDPQKIAFKNYDRSDGLQGNEFNQGAYFENEQGLMFFGGVNGINIFSPDQVQDNPYIPPVVITKFELFNQPVQFGADSPLQQPIEVSPEINLHYTDGFMDFEFSALHYSTPENNQYAYRMEGLDKDWNEVGNRRLAVYTNVPPGNYTFRVRGSNSDGVWNEQGAAVRIVIPPPFWATWWFRMLALSMVILSASAVVTLRIRAIESQRRKLEILVRERTSQLQEAMIELEQSKNAAEAANRAKSAFLANMSHEFRTPLNAILGFSQIMADDEQLQPDQQENVQIIQHSSEHLLGLINDVLEMSKIEAGRSTLNHNGFDLYRLLAGLEEMFKLRAEQKGIFLNLELSTQVPEYVRTDEAKLRQVLMNLLGNAVKFTQQGYITLRVNPIHLDDSLSGPKVRLHFEVKDTGPGITAEEMEKIFLPFMQTSAGQRSQEGTGLGLTISQQFVRLMGGEIKVRSVPGKGSVFYFVIPIEELRAEDIEKPRRTQRVAGLEPGQPAFRLLVVDDQEVNRRLLVKIFSPIGFEIREAWNGEEALKVWEAWEPHLIFMDMRMPVMDGYEATRRIKATTRGQATIIVALTASSLEEDRAIILSEGCDDYMRKPIHEEDLFDMVEKHLGVRYTYKDIQPSETVKTTQAHFKIPNGSESPIESTSDMFTRLARIPPDWLGNLERATILGDGMAIQQLAEQVAETDPDLAAEIIHLAKNYDHEKILALIEQWRRKANDGTE